MQRMLYFPGLGLEFSLTREAFSVGPLTVYWYGLIVVTGILLGALYALRRAKQFGLDPDRVLDVIMYSVVAGVVGSRIYYVAFTWDYYRSHPAEILYVWEGGIAFYGGVIGALVCAVLLCRRWKIPFLVAADASLGGLLLGQAIGRWGNFVNIEAFGGYYTGPWRMVSPVIDSYFHAHPALLAGFTAEQVQAMTDIPVHPTFFYESAWTFLGFLFVVWYTKRRRFTGELTLIYFFWNGLGRAFIEGLRTDSLMWETLRVSQVLAAALAVGSVLLWFWAGGKAAAGVWPVLSLPVPANNAGADVPPPDVGDTTGEAFAGTEMRDAPKTDIQADEKTSVQADAPDKSSDEARRAPGEDAPDAAQDISEEATNPAVLREEPRRTSADETISAQDQEEMQHGGKAD